MSFGSYLKEKREASGLTTTEIAQRMKITQSYVSQLENGIRFPSQKQLPNLARAYGLTEEEAQDRWAEGKIRSVSMGKEYKFGIKEAGWRVPVLESIEPLDDLERRLAEARGFYSVPKDGIPSGHRLFAFQADGIKLADAGILPGDFVVVDLDAAAKEGDLVIVSTPDGIAMTYFHRRGDFLELRPAPDEFKVSYRLDESRVIGRLVYHFKKY